MRQQEANQFDKGLSLDTNAIAMDNHTLSGALNATMITMNGNELVLQNDMGNAKVESAYLPSGFVPVGMQEFGGIVYVASYNPFTKESQLGSFPSPERNISSEESGGGTCTISDLFSGSQSQEVTTLTSRSLLIKGPIRAGDKFVVRSNSSMSQITSAIQQDLITFKVLVLGEDGTGIDITKNMNGYSDASPMGFVKTGTPSDSEYTTYASKFAGEVWLQESLVIPSYITVSITSTAQPAAEGEKQKATIKFTAHAFDSEGNPWELNHPSNNSHLLGFDYYVGSTLLEEGETEVTLGDGIILTYSVIPRYDYGKIMALKQTGSVAVDLLGSGIIEIPSVRYYNDVVNDQFTLDYVINAYVENSEHSVAAIYLQTYDYKNCTIDGTTITSSEDSKIHLTTANSFGSYSAVISYAQSAEGGGKLLKGHMYIARLVAERSTNGMEGTVPYTSDWFVIITSAITNDIYMDTPTAGMLDCKTKHIIPVDWDVEWEEKELGHAYKDECNPEYNTGTSIPTELKEDEKIRLQTTRTGDIILQYKSNVVVDTVDTNFPFDIQTTSTIEVPANVQASSEEEEANFQTFSTVIEYTGGRTKTELLISEENKPINTTYVEDAGINQVWSNLSLQSSEGRDVTYNEDGTVERRLHYQVQSQFIAEPSERLNFIGNDMPALVQYQTMLAADQETVRDMVGSDVFYAFDTTPAGSYRSLKPQTWWSWGTRKGKKKNTRERLMGLMAANGDYERCSEVVEEIPEMESMTDTGYGIFNTSTTNASWRYYSTVTMDYIHNSLKLYPYLFFWQGAKDDSTEMRVSNGAPTTDYSIPIMLDASGEMYLIGQYSSGYGHGDILKDIVQCFSNIYVYQQGQTVSYNYYKASNELDKYVYTNPYQMKIECTYRATPELKFMVDEETEYVGGAVTFNGENIFLPEFIQAETSKHGSEEKQFVKYVYSPDQVAKNLEYLDAEPSLGNVAVVKNADGTMSVVATAVKVGSDGMEEGSEPIDVSHVYFGVPAGKDTKLYDCTKTMPSSTEGLAGRLIADAVKNRYLRVIYSSENDRNILIINKSAVTNKSARTCNIEIGTNKMRTSLAGIASKHLLAVPLFTGSTIHNMQITTS